MKWTNAIAFQLTWFACVLGGTAWGSVALAALGINAYAASDGRESLRADVKLALVLGAFGWLLDTAWVQLGLLDYGAATAPVWIVLLWLAVALTLNHSLRFLQGRPVLGGVLAGCAAPGSYLTGESLGAVTVPDNLGLLAIGIAWACIFYILFSTLGAKSARREQAR
ncbi:MAG: DUF2878 domain-containing protein [Gammaproteobacteria bacterium]